MLQTLDKRPTIDKIIAGFRREESWADMIIKEDSLASGVSTNQDKSKTRTKRRDQKREDMKTLILKYESLRLEDFLKTMNGICSGNDM